MLTANNIRAIRPSQGSSLGGGPLGATPLAHNHASHVSSALSTTQQSYPRCIPTSMQTNEYAFTTGATGSTRQQRASSVLCAAGGDVEFAGSSISSEEARKFDLIAASLVARLSGMPLDDGDEGGWGEWGRE